MDRPSKHRAQHGISLVESLVALVVMSVGMLGIASLYVTSLQASRSALIRTHAVNLVNDMADRIRANAGARGAYHLASYSATDLPTQAPGCLASNNCSPATLAAYDLATWLSSFGSYLPGTSQGNVTYTAGTTGEKPDQYEVSVVWKEAGDVNPTTGKLDSQSYKLAIELQPVK